MIRRPPRSTPLYSSAASDVYKRQESDTYLRMADSLLVSRGSAMTLIVCVSKWNVNTGSIDIATSDVSGRQMTDRWFSLTAPSPTVRKDTRSLPPTPLVIRIKVHFRSIKILPVGLYKPLIEVHRRCRMICRWCCRVIWSFSHFHIFTLNT